ncbi:MAG: bifunctional enoyl-CoA hydratase/phosphate acetyltransferase [Candidatus Eisenbacteria bacterium]|nr:bifunctional enoyl-CoA hydratase/phosphate acetyltransferase [Candidatus Eisenbacteria bacterium]
MAAGGPPRTFDEIRERALEYGKSRGKARLGIAAAWDPCALEAASEASGLGLVEPVLVGGEEAIRSAASDEGIDIEDWVIVPAEDSVAAAAKTIDLVRSGDVDFIMKGKVQTADLMRAALNKETGIRAGKLMSHLALLWTPTFGRILGLSDGGIVLSPDVEKKADIIRNSVDGMHKLGWENPNVAVICGLEIVNPAMPCTVDAAELAKMNQRGQIEGCVVDGPFGFDNAISEIAAERKGVESPIAGKADLVIVPEIEVGNVLYKGLVFMTEGVRTAGVLLGARVPIVMVSRSDGSDAKLNAIAVGAVIAHASKGR